ncbi:hypothetical protein LguiA_031027 [Lonicera macranthoides]
MSSRMSQIHQSITTIRRPWREFLNPSTLTLPISLTESTYRIRHNLHHFRFNYSVILLSILFLSLLYHPISIIVFLITLIAWLYFYLFRDEPIVMFDYTVDELVVLALLSIGTLIALILTRVWLNVFVSLVIGVTVICLHGAFRGIDDIDDQESGYGPLLSVVDG